MKILITSKIFYPSNRIGAVRPTNFAKFLACMGHTVTVITEDLEEKNEFSLNGVNIHRFSNYKFLNKLKKSRGENTKSGQINNKTSFKSNEAEAIKNRLKILRMIFFNLLVEICWFYKVRKEFKGINGNNTYDFVISSYGPLSSYLLGKWIKKRKLAKNWACDFRDNMTNVVYPQLLNKYYKSQHRYALKRADLIFFVSNGQKNMFINSLSDITFNFKDKIYVIYNGYESNPEMKESEVNTRDNILRFAYTGQLYSGRSSFKMLFEVIKELIEENYIDPHQILIEYAGQSSIYFDSQIQKYENLSLRVINHGFVDREVALQMQKNSDILIALTWNTEEEQGILTGKFLEYMQYFKPIISLTTGNLSNGELTGMVENMKLGVACEYGNYKQSFNKLKEYIKMQYSARQSNHAIVHAPNLEKIRDFHYSKIVEKLNVVLLKNHNPI